MPELYLIGVVYFKAYINEDSSFSLALRLLRALYWKFSLVL